MINNNNIHGNDTNICFFRGPVEKLQEEYQVLCEELSQVFDDSLQKWRQG